MDFGRTAKDYAAHRTEYPDRLFEQLQSFGVRFDGQTVLDLGTGTGNLARGFARRGAKVTGLDASEALMEEAKRLDAEAGVDVAYVKGDAERMSMPPDTDFDVVSAGDAWGWFERHKAMRETRRMLKPGGWLVFAQFDALPLRENPVEATEKLLEKYNPEWSHGGGTGLHPEWMTDVRHAGFRAVQTFSFDVDVSFSHREWRGFVRASPGVKASLAPDEAARFDEKLRSKLAESFPEPLAVPFCCWTMVAQAPQA
ncbi:MAG: class I SAM-dependent methyltransferase [Myxococcota bacterium]